MARLATPWQKSMAPAASGAPPTGPVRVEDLFRLRTLPNADVYFYCKHIDNSGVVREPDPRERSHCWSAIGVACLLGLLLIALLAPNMARLAASYQLEDLKKEQTNLRSEWHALDIYEARLTREAHLQELAKSGQFESPVPGQVIHLDPKGDSKLALNRH
jgi:hypothetical protein